MCESIQNPKIFNELNILTIGIIDDRLILITKNLFLYDVSIESFDEKTMELDLRNRHAISLSLAYSDLMNDERFKSAIEKNQLHSSFSIRISSTEPRICFLSIDRFAPSINYLPYINRVESDQSAINFDTTKFQNEIKEFVLSNNGLFEIFVWRNHFGSKKSSVAMRKLSSDQQSKDDRVTWEKLSQNLTFQSVCLGLNNRTIYILPTGLAKCNRSFYSDAQIGFLSDRFAYILSKDSVQQMPKEIFNNFTEPIEFKTNSIGNFFKCPTTCK